MTISSICQALVLCSERELARESADTEGALSCLGESSHQFGPSALMHCPGPSNLSAEILGPLCMMS